MKKNLSAGQDHSRGARNFKTKFVDALKKVWLVYPTANLCPERSVLRLFPSQAHIKSVQIKDVQAVDNLSYPRSNGSGKVK